MRTETRFSDHNSIAPALHDLKPGERMVYHSGDLAYERGDRGNVDKDNLNFIANTAYKLHLEGKVCLIQRVVSHYVVGSSPPVSDYIAVGCHQPYIPQILKRR